MGGKDASWVEGPINNEWMVSKWKEGWTDSHSMDSGL